MFILEESEMKSLRYPLALTILMLALPLSAVAGDMAWFDLENCGMCKNMSAEEGLMEAMTWENHLTADGMMSVTVVAHGHEEAFKRSMENMEKTGQKMMAGEKMELCGFCSSYGNLAMAGATIENFETAAGHVGLVTSRDPAVIKQIHAHGQKTIEEYSKMFGGEDHPHGDEHPKGGEHPKDSEHPKGDH